jgi:hypothetical protein
MGYFSDQMIHEAEQRLRLGGLEGKKVCSRCFGDPHLSNLIEENANADACDYCRDKGAGVQATDLSTVLEYMLPQIDLEYDRADEALPRDPETKGRMFPEDEMDTRTMLEMEIGLELPRDDNGALMEDIAEAMPEQDWCYRDPLIELPAERVGNSWEAFKTVVTHRRRFFLLQYEDRDLDYDLTWGAAAYTIPELLKRIAQYSLDHGLVMKMEAKTPWVRCQWMAPGERNFDARRMGPPPYERATLPNRMSPVGVPMFYGAIDRETALAEIADKPGRFAAGTFITTRDVLVLDVRKAPEVPSLFDAENAKDRPIAEFMKSFIEDFRKSIDREEKPHIDYLPTQVITEYFRTLVTGPKKQPIEGVLYSSTKNGRDAIVLFAENGDVVGGADDELSDKDQWLEMVAYEEVDYTPPGAAAP